MNSFCDDDWENDPDSRKIRTVFVLMINGGAVAWAARRQTIIAQSTAEAEYVAACGASMEGREIANMLDEILLCIKVKNVLTIGVDNSATITLVCTSTNSNKTRPIELR